MLDCACLAAREPGLGWLQTAFALTQGTTMSRGVIKLEVWWGMPGTFTRLVILTSSRCSVGSLRVWQASHRLCLFWLLGGFSPPSLSCHSPQKQVRHEEMKDHLMAENCPKHALVQNHPKPISTSLDLLPKREAVVPCCILQHN